MLLVHYFYFMNDGLRCNYSLLEVRLPHLISPLFSHKQKIFLPYFRSFSLPIEIFSIPKTRILRFYSIMLIIKRDNIIYALEDLEDI